MAYFFSLFNCAPDYFSKYRIVFSTSLISSSDSTSKAVSSANREILNRWFLPLGMPLIFVVSLIALTKISEPKIYSSGDTYDSGNPWRRPTPRDTSKNRDTRPLYWTAARVFWWIVLTCLMKGSGFPKKAMTLSRIVLSSRS